MAKSPEFIARRERQAVEAVHAMADYRKAEGAALDRLARLRAERTAREAVQGSEAEMPQRQ